MSGLVPQRRCVSCRQLGSKLELIRLVRTPPGEVRLDPEGKTPGRGAYVHRLPACLDQARKRSLLDRALRARVPGEVLHQLTAPGPHEA